MTNNSLSNRLECLSAEIETLQEKAAEQISKRANALADQEMARPGTTPHAQAQARETEANQLLAELTNKIEGKKAALAILNERATVANDPQYLAETDKQVKAAKKLRGILDQNALNVARETRRLAGALEKLRLIEIELAQTVPDFDQLGTGRGSVVTWIQDKLSPYFGNGAYPFKEGAPELPGEYFAAPSTIETRIRESRERGPAK